MFRAQLILHDKVREVFERSLRLAREQGYLKRGRGMRVSLDTTYILGREAVKDTFNLLADGIAKLMRVLAMAEDVPLRRWAETHGCQRYVGSSMKGEAAIDWSDRQARRKLLGEIVADADQLLELARQAQDRLFADSAEGQAIVGSAELLGQLLLQDVKRDDDGDADGGVSLKDGVSKDRIVSVHDREMRHGHKSSKRRFDGHKAAVVDTGTPADYGGGCAPGNAWNSTRALGLVEDSKISAGAPVVEAMGDTAYGDRGTRQDFADAGRKLVARVPGRPNSKRFPKDDFVIDLVTGTCPVRPDR